MACRRWVEQTCKFLLTVNVRPPYLIKILLLCSEGHNILSRQICMNDSFQINLAPLILITSELF